MSEDPSKRGHALCASFRRALSVAFEIDAARIEVRLAFCEAVGDGHALAFHALLDGEPAPAEWAVFIVGLLTTVRAEMIAERAAREAAGSRTWN